MKENKSLNKLKRDSSTRQDGKAKKHNILKCFISFTLNIMKVSKPVFLERQNLSKKLRSEIEKRGMDWNKGTRL